MGCRTLPYFFLDHTVTFTCLLLSVVLLTVQPLNLCACFACGLLSVSFIIFFLKSLLLLIHHHVCTRVHYLKSKHLVGIFIYSITKLELKTTSIFNVTYVYTTLPAIKINPSKNLKNPSVYYTLSNAE